MYYSTLVYQLKDVNGNRAQIRQDSERIGREDGRHSAKLRRSLIQYHLISFDIIVYVESGWHYVECRSYAEIGLVE